MKATSLALFTVVLTALTAVARLCAAAEFPIHDGERVVFLGDSITDQRLYTTAIEAYTLTRFPQWKLTFRNIGWGGDTAKGGLERAARDLLPLKPTFVTIDFGMNDHGYRAHDEGIYKNYIDKQTQLVALLKTNGSRVALVTPQPIEERRPDPDKDVRNASLRTMSDGLREIAGKENVLFADQFDPYMTVMLKARQTDPLAHIGGGDAVHPGPVGHTIMAWAILKSLGAPAAVSSAELTAAGTIVAATGCTISDLKVDAGVLSFTRKDATLPLPVNPQAEAVTTLIPLLADLSRYELKVTGLTAPKYRLLIDDQPVAVFTPQELAQGCNLTLSAGPITDQARQLWDLVVAKNNGFATRWRAVQLFAAPQWAKSAGIEAAREKELTQLDGQIAQLETKINALRQPLAHTFVLKPAAAPQATITINTDAPSEAYNWMIFGGFLEHFSRQIYGGLFEPGSPLADAKGFRLDAIEALQELKVPVIRWPGGCFVDSYHWLKGVGKDRQPYDDVRWGVIEPNTFGTDEFVQLCRRLGAEPYICHNGLADVQEMANWVEYCNATKGPFADMRKANGHPEPYNVKFWSVGNEMQGKAYIDRVRDGARAMREIDPTILVTCSGSHGPEARVDAYLYETAGKDLNLMSIHEYWIANYQVYKPTDYLGCMMLSEKPDAHVTAIVKSIAAAGLQGRIKIAFDEWNLRSWHHPGFPRTDKVDPKDSNIVAYIKAREKSLVPAVYTMADALFCASFLNACLRNADDVAMANIAPLVNDTGPLYVHPKGLVKRTHFHTLAMYANELQPRVGKLDIQAEKLSQGAKSVSVADAIATVDESGKQWAIALVNRHPDEEVVCAVTMKDRLLDGEYAATVLSGDSPDSFNDIENPSRVIPRKATLAFTKGVVRLPPHSLTVVKVPLQ